MTSMLLDSPPSLFGAGCRPRPSGDGRVTLEERLEAVLHAARSVGRAECPVCQAPMRADGAVARCTGCGSMLS